MQTATVITGVTGFLGSHLALRILRQIPDTILICLARAKNLISARARVLNALQTATMDCAEIRLEQAILDRVVVLDENMFSGASQPDTTRFACFCVSSFWHCAASTRFVDSKSSSVWDTNINGLRNALRLAGSLKVDVFNYVSTAYVSGTLLGRVSEEVDRGQNTFNNVYEKSKHDCELLVQHECNTLGIAYRILRPSIIIGHSRTFRTSSSAGFYQCLEALRQLYRKVTAKDVSYFERTRLGVFLNRNATLDLIPIDIVIAEMLMLENYHRDTFNQVFHVTSESPCSMYDVLTTLADCVGIRSVEIVDRLTDLSAIDKLFNRQVKVFVPYCTQRKLFDRNNATRLGLAQYQFDYLLDMGRVKCFAAEYISSVPQTGVECSSENEAAAA